ncbi:MAG: CorA family divalent cation transporter [Marmoricola sp.]
MELLYVDQDGIRVQHLGDDTATGGFVWVDIPEWSEEAEEYLRGLGCHEMELESCQSRNHVPTVHGYADHVFITTQSPLLGRAGHVHLLELDQIIGRDYFVTVHGPLNPIVDPLEAVAETEAVRRRIESGRFRPSTPHELSFAVTSAVARRQRGLITDVAQRLPGLERHVMESRLTNPEELLERMFLIRHELITARTMAAQCHDVWSRMAGLSHLPDDSAREYLRDLADQFDRVRSIADGESHFLFGVIELYQTKVNTKMTVAMERLAVIAAVTLPITAIASIEGMNMIVSTGENMVEFGIVILIMAVMSFLLLRWAREQGWW